MNASLDRTQSREAKVYESIQNPRERLERSNFDTLKLFAEYFNRQEESGANFAFPETTHSHKNWICVLK
jgi:hypothetical protein